MFVRLAGAVVVFLVCGSLWADSFNIGLEGGFAPNIMTQRDQFEAISLANQRVERRRNDAALIYGDRVQIKDFVFSGSELNSLPFGVNARYIYNKLFFRMAFINHLIQPVRSRYTLNTRPGTDSSIANGRNLYHDLDLNEDNDVTNDYSYAVGLARTYGNDYRYSMYTTGEMYEIPFTFGVVLIGKQLYKFYLGAGLVFFQANTTRVIDVHGLNADGSTYDLSGPGSQRDIDKFTGNALGFHFLAGAEYTITSRFGLYAELAYNFGASVPLEDNIQTGANTVDSLYQANTPEDPGGTEVAGSPSKPARPRMSGLNFVSIRLAVGFTYYLALQDTPRGDL